MCMTSIENRRLAIQDGIALEGVTDPDVDSYEKQLGEFEILLKTGPVPNAEYQKAQQAIQAAAQKIHMNQAGGIPAADADMQQVAQMEAELQNIPPLVSSVPVKSTDNHEAESAACIKRINSPEGRKLSSGTAKERLAFSNLTLHWQEHTA